MDRRIFLAVSGTSLTAPAWEYVDRLGSARGGSFVALADARRSITITPAMVDAVAATTVGIRNLGDGEGGNNDNLRFVHPHLIWVAKLLRQARFTSGSVPVSPVDQWPTSCSPSGRNWRSWRPGWLRTQVNMGWPSGTSPAGCTPLTPLATARWPPTCWPARARLPATRSPASVRAFLDQLRATHSD